MTALSGRARTPIDADNRKVPKDFVARGQAYDLSQGGDGLTIPALSAINLDRQIASDGATWLDRQIIAEDLSEIRDSGFGRKAISRRARRLDRPAHHRPTA